MGRRKKGESSGRGGAAKKGMKKKPGRKKKRGRTAWDEVMRDELGIKYVPGESAEKKREAAGRRRETRHMATAKKSKSKRRAGARKWVAGTDTISGLERKIRARLERLECTNHGDPLDRDDDDEAQDSEDEYIDASDVESAAGKKRKAKRKPKRKRAKKASAVFLHQALLNAAAKGDGTVMEYIRAAAAPSAYPQRKFCAVSGAFAKYKDAQSGLRVQSRRLLDEVQETPPPWVHASGHAPFFDAIDMLKSEL